MKRRTLLLIVVGMAGGTRFASAQRLGRMARIGFLGDGNMNAQAAYLQRRQGLRELGWVAGQNIAIAQRWADGGQQRRRPGRSVRGTHAQATSDRQGNIPKGGAHRHVARCQHRRQLDRKTAPALGIATGQTFLLRADRVIE